MRFQWDETLENRYRQVCTRRGNIHDHMPTLLKYGQLVDTITEFGVESGGSTSAWLMAKPKKVTCYDIVQNKDLHLSQYEKWAKERDIDFKFIVANSTKIEIEPTELLFIDTEHKYDVLSKELLHHNKVSKYMIFHDTVSFPGMAKAIYEFLDSHEEWQMKEHFEYCHGLTVIERIK